MSMEAPNFTELYNVYRFIARCSFSSSPNADFVICSETMSNKVRYMIKYQGCIIYHTYVISEVFAYLYIKGIDKSEVIISI